jgi:hypothetical protein
MIVVKLDTVQYRELKKLRDSADARGDWGKYWERWGDIMGMSPESVADLFNDGDPLMGGSPTTFWGVSQDVAGYNSTRILVIDDMPNLCTGVVVDEID